MFSYSIVLAVLVASSTLAEEFSPNDGPSEKRSPLGLGGIQGTKSLTSLENDDFVKRAPMGFQGMRGKKDLIRDNEDNLAAEEELEKRSQMGFYGTRGKKEYLEPDFEGSYFPDEYYKRALMGFQGMRGKKALFNDDYYKRAAMGFQGMRGKKSSDYLLDELTDEYEKRTPLMGFQSAHNFADEWVKRAPMGFQGMRGKKSSLAEMNDLEKRAMMGFQGMRGKKDDYFSEYRPVRSIADPDEKSADSKYKRLYMGFVGSRGKRSDLKTDSEYSKNSPYGVQGALASLIMGNVFSSPDKRYYGYSGTRGKKFPQWEMRGKFIGVRGKK